MNVFHKVTRESLRKNRLRTIVTIVGVLLSAAMVCAVTTIVVSFQGFYGDCEVYETGDWYGRVERADQEVRLALEAMRRVKVRMRTNPIFTCWAQTPPSLTSCRFGQWGDCRSRKEKFWSPSTTCL